MKVILINTVANTGSTGRITTDLYKALVKEGNEACIAYGRGNCDSNINSYKVSNIVDFFFHVWVNFFKGESGFSSTRLTKKLIRFLQEEKPDIIHLHNIHGFYLNCEVLFTYIKSAGIEVVWKLHDCWAFTGHCAYFDDVEWDKCKTQCQSCT